jgi:hypothetical protein
MGGRASVGWAAAWLAIGFRETFMAQARSGSATFGLLNVLPLLVFPLIIYNVLVFSGMLGQRSAIPEGKSACLSLADGRSYQPDSGCLTTVDQGLDSAVFTIGMFSGDVWHVSFGDVFLALSLLLLFIEIVKATRTDSTSIINHGLSMIVAVTCIIQFVVAEGFSNSVFFLLTLMTLLDVVAGFTVTIVAAKRDFGSSGGIAGTQ